jgi:hypothetical protein
MMVQKIIMICMWQQHASFEYFNNIFNDAPQGC